MYHKYTLTTTVRNSWSFCTVILYILVIFLTIDTTLHLAYCLHRTLLSHLLAFINHPKQTNKKITILDVLNFIKYANTQS